MTYDLRYAPSDVRMRIDFLRQIPVEHGNTGRSKVTTYQDQEQNPLPTARYSLAFLYGLDSLLVLSAHR